jgi:hypothetical protein
MAIISIIQALFCNITCLQMRARKPPNAIKTKKLRPKRARTSA